MKNIYLLLFSFLYCIFLYSQSYKPLFKENKFWYVEEFSFETGDRCHLLTCEDTLINTLLYFQLVNVKIDGNTGDTIKQNFGVFLREDTVTQRIYRKNGSTEYVCFDLNKNVGDTISNQTIVDSIVSVSLINGEVVKKIHFSEHSGLHENSFFIEGVGWENGLFGDYFYQPVGPSTYLKCVVEDGQTVWTDYENTCIDDNLSCIYTNVGIKDMENNLVKAFPNPTNGLVTFQTEINQKCIVEVFNLYGEKVLEKAFENTTTVNLKEYANQLLFYIIKTEKLEDISIGKIFIK